jgi:PAS domain S-box-containing protein
MKTKGDRPCGATELRRLAEQRLRERKTEVVSPGTEQDMLRLVHELQVHQIELEMQNEELIQARSELEAGLDRYADLYDFAPVGYFSLDRDGTIRQANLTGTSLLGIERSRLVNRRLQLFIPDEARPAFNAFLEKVFAGRSKEACEVMLAREGNEPLVVRIDAVAREDGQGCRAAMSDISDLKRAHGKLTEALAQLARSNKELESFAYAASHDLRGPLITITGFVGRLAKDSEQGDAKRMHSDIARIGEATRKMDRLLRDVLELSRIGRVVVSPEDVSLTELAREVAGLLAGPIAERGVRIEISPDLPTVHGERARLTQLLMNLLGNAVKFMGEQPDPQVKIGVRRDGEETVCYVRDNGIGIDAQHKDAIFGLFQQLDPSRGGTGIGLSVAKRVVETHGGRIWLESDGPGKGSTFCFTLVRKAEPVTEEEQENERFLPKTLARVAG